MVTSTVYEMAVTNQTSIMNAVRTAAKEGNCTNMRDWSPELNDYVTIWKRELCQPPQLSISTLWKTSRHNLVIQILKTCTLLQMAS